VMDGYGARYIMVPSRGKDSKTPFAVRRDKMWVLREVSVVVLGKLTCILSSRLVLLTLT
jgi:hypothetical protein